MGKASKQRVQQQKGQREARAAHAALGGSAGSGPAAPLTLSTSMQESAASSKHILHTLVHGTHAQRETACNVLAHFAQSHIANAAAHANASATTAGARANRAQATGAAAAATIPPCAHPDIIKVLIPLVYHQEYSVALAAAGAVRSLSAISQRVCAVLLERDLLSVLLTCLNPLDPRLQQQTPEQRAALMTQVLSTLCNLTENYDVVLVHLSRSPVALPTLFVLLDPAQATAELMHEVAQFLFTITEANVQLVEAIRRTPDWLHRLRTIAFGGDAGANSASAIPTSVRVAICGVMLNLYSSTDVHALPASALPLASLASLGAPSATDAPSASLAFDVAHAVRVLSSVLDTNVLALTGEMLTVAVQQKAEFVSKLPAAASSESSSIATATTTSTSTNMQEDVAAMVAEAATAASAGASSSSMHADAADSLARDEADEERTLHLNRVEQQWLAALDKLLRQWRGVMGSIQQAAEVLTNLFSIDGAGDAPAENEVAVTPAASLSPTTFLSQLLIHFQVPAKVVQMLNVRPTPEQVAAFSSTLDESDAQSWADAFITLRTRFAALLSNLVLLTPLSVLLLGNDADAAADASARNLAFIGAVCQPILAIGQQVSQLQSGGGGAAKAQLPDLVLDELETFTQLLWHTLRSKSTDLPYSQELVALFVDLARSKLAPAARIHAIGCLSALGQYPAFFASANLLIGAALIDQMRSTYHPQAATAAAGASSGSSLSSASSSASALPTEDQFEAALEAMDGLIDMYSEDQAPIMESLQRLHMLDELQRAVHANRQILANAKRARGFRTSDGGGAAAPARGGGGGLDRSAQLHWEEILENGEAFVHYKRSLIASSSRR